MWCICFPSSWTVRLLATVVLSMACATYGRRVRVSEEPLRGKEQHNLQQRAPSALASLLLSSKLAAAWHSHGMPQSIADSRGTRLQPVGKIHYPKDFVRSGNIAMTDEQISLEEAFNELADEIEEKKSDELRQIAYVKGKEAGYDWDEAELLQVLVKEANSSGLVLEEVVCEEDMCQQVDIPIPWPAGMPISQLPEMRKAFAALANKAFFANMEHSDLPPVYLNQQQEVFHIMSLVNSEFSEQLRLYAIENCGLDTIYEIKESKMTQLNYAGFTLELKTMDEAHVSRMESFRWRDWSTSVNFPKTCRSAEEVEKQLVEMLTFPEVEAFKELPREWMR